MFSFSKWLVAFIAVITFHGVEARADTFVIPDAQGSAFVITSIDGGPPTIKARIFFSLGGPGLSITSSFPPLGGADTGNVEARDACIVNTCPPGMVIGTNSSFSGIIAPADGAHATVHGVQYPFVRLTGALNFVSEPIEIPNALGGFQVTIPFTFSGELTGTAFQPDVVNPIFIAMFRGQGKATFHFEDVSFSTTTPRYRLDFIEYRFEPPVPISIDIKPVTFPNSINPKSKGKIPVAILTTDSFDATAVDPATVLFGANGIEAAPVQYAIEDVDEDGDADMVLHFDTHDTGITCGDISASLTGATFSGVRIKGSDSLETVACK
jgi:hypothetical protein